LLISVENNGSEAVSQAQIGKKRVQNKKTGEFGNPGDLHPFYPALYIIRIWNGAWF